MPEIEFELERAGRLLNELGVAYFVLGVDPFEIIHVSPGAVAIAGVRAEGALEDAVPLVVHPDDQARVFTCLARVVPSGLSESASYRLIRQDGSVRSVSAQLKGARLPDGRQVVVGTLTDLTEQLASEHERHAHEQTRRRMQGLVEGIPDAAVVLDERLRLVAVNRTAADTIGVDPTTLIGQSLPEQVAPAEVVSVIREAFRSEQAMSRVLRSVLTNRRYDVTLFPSAGVVTVIARDIEDRLQEQERFRTIVETQQEAVSVSAPDTTLRYANGALLRMVGHASIVGTRWINHVPVGERDRILTHLRSLSPASPTKTIEYEQETPAGRRMFQWCDTMLFDDNGVAREHVAIGRDVTDERARVAEQNADLMERVLLLRELHHGVKNNLQIVASMVRLRLDVLDDTAAIAVGREVEERVRVMGLIHDLLHDAADPGRLDVNHLFSKLVHLIQQVHGRPDVHVTTTTRLAPLPVDRAMSLSRAVHELLCNALKHAFPAVNGAHENHDSHHIDHARHVEGDGDCDCGCARPHRVSVTLDAEGETLILEVEDNGRGLPDERPPQSGRRSWGLQIIESIAQQQGGTFNVGSGVGGRGVRARLSLPGSG